MTSTVSLVWLTIALPFTGFLVNGVLGLRRPNAKGAVSLVGPGVLIAAFAVAVGIFLDLWGHPPHEPAVLSLWHWLPLGRLQVDFALQVDQLSAVMMLIITGVG